MKAMFRSAVPLLILVAAASTMWGCSGARGTAEAIYEAHGGDQFLAEVERIDYTFNMKAGRQEVTRRWIWHPSEDEVTLRQVQGADTTDVKFVLAQVEADPDAPEVEKLAGRLFLDDNFWLLFPYQMIWREDATFEVDGPARLPVGEGRLKRLHVNFPQPAGYVPGDRYRLYYEKDHTLKAWTYRPASKPESATRASWEDMREVGPLKLYLRHESPRERLEVWFTNVAVKFRGSDEAIRVE